MESVHERVVAHCKATVGKFHTTIDLASTIGHPVEQMRETLGDLYRLGLIDRFIHIEGDKYTGHYGHHRGVAPGTALIENTRKGSAA